LDNILVKLLKSQTDTLLVCYYDPKLSSVNSMFNETELVVASLFIHTIHL